MSQEIVKENRLKAEIKSFIVKWNEKFPIDHWWREKYKVPFGSEVHRSANFIQMFIDYQEEKMVNEFRERQKEKKKEEDEGEYAHLDKKVAGKEMSKKQLDDAFDNLDLTKYNTNK